MRLYGAVRPGDWTAEEVAYLREWASKKTGREIAEHLGRTKHATLRKMAVEGIKGIPHGSRRQLSEEHRKALEMVQPGTITRRQFALKHGMSEEAVRWWANKLNIPFRLVARFTPEEITRMKELAPAHTPKEIAELLGKDADSVRDKLRDMGVKAKSGLRIPRPWIKPNPTSKRSMRMWKPEEDEKLRAMEGRLASEVAAAFNRTVRSVEHRARRLGIPLVYGRREYHPKPKAAPIRKAVLQVSRLEWCWCGAPVSDWQGHFERLGHRRPAA